jgi:plasmid stability protein
MPTLLIRNLDQETIRNLKARAKRHNRSLQVEARLILEDHANRRNEPALAIVERWQGYFAGRTFSDSAELVRENRETIAIA